MRRKILGSIAVLAIVAVAAFNMNLNTQKSDLSDLSLANIEALAQGEGNGGGFPSTVTFGCAVIVDVIIGWYSDGSPIIVKTAYSGYQGECVGPPGSCSPYGCTRIY